MKYINRILLLLVCVCTLVSCVSEKHQKQFELSLKMSQDPVTRIGLTDNYVTYWNTGDQASVFYKSNTPTLWTYVGEDGANAGVIEYKGNPFDVSGEDIFALMPYNETASLKSGSINFVLPSAQVVGNGRITPVMVSHSTSDELVFHYATALVKVTLKGSCQVAALTLTGNNNEVLCGPASVDMTSSEPHVVLDAEASGREIRLLSDVDGLLADIKEGQTDLYISVPQMIFTDGFTLAVEYSRGGVQKIDYTGQVSLAAGKIYDIGSIETNDELVLELDFNQRKTNAADAAKAIKAAYGAELPTAAGTLRKDYTFTIDGQDYTFKFDYCPDTSLPEGSKGHYLGVNESQACLLLSTNGWYISLPKIEGHVLRWISTVAGRTISADVASTTEYFVTTDVSSSRGVARNCCVSDRLTPPQKIGEEHFAYIGDADPSADYYLTQYGGGWLYIQKLRIGYKRIK